MSVFYGISGGFVVGVIVTVIALYFVYRNNKCRFNAIEEIAKKGSLTQADIIKIYNISTGRETCS